MRIDIDLVYYVLIAAALFLSAYPLLPRSRGVWQEGMRLMRQEYVVRFLVPLVVGGFIYHVLSLPAIAAWIVYYIIPRKVLDNISLLDIALRMPDPISALPSIWRDFYRATVESGGVPPRGSEGLIRSAPVTAAVVMALATSSSSETKLMLQSVISELGRFSASLRASMMTVLSAPIAIGVASTLVWYFVQQSIIAIDPTVSFLIQEATLFLFILSLEIIRRRSPVPL